MAYYLPSNTPQDSDGSDAPAVDRSPMGQMADLKIFWGPEICRLEYLLHLLDTGRIVDEWSVPSA